jgi:methylenetetrahydrofolate reductase (NADPH)
MHALGPAFVDVTWNAGGRLSNLTCEMVNMTQSVYGLETCMHLTCTGMPKSKVDDALKVRLNRAFGISDGMNWGLMN